MKMLLFVHSKLFFIRKSQLIITQLPWVQLELAQI